MIDALLPHYTYRRLVVRLAFNSLRRRERLKPRLTARNCRYFSQYSGSRFTCNVCARHSRAFFDFPDLELRREHHIGDLRETLQCVHCGATMRQRTLAAALLQVASARMGRTLADIPAAAQAGFAGLRTLDTDAFSPMSRQLRSTQNYLVSSFRPELEFGAQIEANHFNINLENASSLPDGSFDVVVTSDVMEHVRDIDAAHREIARILKPGGSYVFTVPYDERCETHCVLVDTSGPSDRFLVPPHFHGDPLTGGILAYRIFGRGIFGDLERLGLQPRFMRVCDPGALIVDGDVFIATKRGS